ncbi:MAG TPA: hypothetical protein VFU21_13530 [Kofleriaceae bacterium]|nr:hypothetical protein [Kofleriaceae bacterium]
MLRRLSSLLLVASLGLTLLAAGGCNRGGAQGPAFPQPIRDEKEPGESFDTVSAVPDTGSSSVEGMSGGSTETEVEIDEGSSADDDADDDKEGEKSADKSTDASDEGDDGGEDETGDEPDDVEIEIEP